jgi:iron-sulfur cluster repair protein YtfE (RIC family)
MLAAWACQPAGRINQGDQQMGTAKPNDAIGMLMTDHREVEEMFKQFEELGERAKVSKKRIADQICEALTMHAALEEEIFYPAVREAGKEFEELIDEAYVEHAAAKDLISQIQAEEANEELFDAKVKVLQEQIEHHVQEEEKELFPKVRKAALDLQALGEEMQARKESGIDGTVIQPPGQSGRPGARI